MEYKKGHRIITQGETGDAFYILVSGRCDCSVDLPSGDSKVVMQLKVGTTPTYMYVCMYMRITFQSSDSFVYIQ